MNSISTSIARALYGRSDKANDKANQSAEWQAGYKHGLVAQDGGESIDAEFKRRDCVMSEGFREWKKGMWAAIMQRAEIHLEQQS
jgi:hypothetical protein